MSRKTASLLPAAEELLRQFGERLRLARQRRHLTAKQVAERAGMTPMTLRSLERGGSGVTIGAYLAVMQVLGIEKELGHIAQADPVGRSLQDARLARSSEPSPTPRGGVREATTRANKNRTRAESRTKNSANSVVERGLVSSRDLAALLTGPAVRSKTRRR